MNSSSTKFCVKSKYVIINSSIKQGYSSILGGQKSITFVLWVTKVLEIKYSQLW